MDQALCEARPIVSQSVMGIWKKPVREEAMLSRCKWTFTGSFANLSPPGWSLLSCEQISGKIKLSHTINSILNPHTFLILNPSNPRDEHPSTHDRDYRKTTHQYSTTFTMWISKHGRMNVGGVETYPPGVDDYYHRRHERDRHSGEDQVRCIHHLMVEESADSF
jgi:hypothetical protein